MKLQRIILGLELLIIAMVSVIFVWQIVTLPGLRTQVQTGLQSTLVSVGRDAAVHLDREFASQTQTGAREIQSLDLEFTESNLEEMQLEFSRMKATQPIASAWVVVFLDTTSTQPVTYEYIPPGRFRPESDFAGSWRRNTDISNFARDRVDSLISKAGSTNEFIRSFQQQSLDSLIVFVYARELQSNLMIGTPIFHEKGNLLAGFIFALMNDQYIENRFIPQFFNEKYQTSKDILGGIEERYFRYGVFSNKGNQLIYNSVAFGRRDFEVVFNMDDIGSPLVGMKIGVSFRDASVAQVANSIYERNFWFITLLFIALIVVLIFLFLAARRLLQLSQLKTEFVANVSHEIKTPLASIRLATDTLRLGRVQSPEQQEGLVNVLMRESTRLEHLVHTLLDFSQLEAGRKKYKKEGIPVVAWWQNATRLVKEKAQTSMGEISGEVPSGQLFIDRLAVDQVLTILTDNAIKYGGASPKVDLILHSKPGWIIAGVRDHGIGIANKDQKIIFDKFVRLGNLDVHDVKGHGIGLSIASAIMREMGGHISLDSEPGKGSTFWLHLPLKEE